MTKEIDFQTIGKEIGNLVSEKNKAYNNSLNSVGDILKILYPNGIKIEEYHIVSTLVRLLDKLKRMSADPNNQENYIDLAGYCILKLGLLRQEDSRNYIHKLSHSEVLAIKSGIKR